MSIAGFPRTAMGANGRQRWIHNSEELHNLIEEGNGVGSVFISHNSYPDPEHPPDHEGPCPSIARVRFVKVQQQFIDLDSDKLSNALNDCRKLLEWFEKEQLPYTVAFSGKKGFQINLLFEPRVYDISEEVMVDSETTVQWRSYYTAVYNYLKVKLDLRTIDFVCAEPKHVMRVWNTLHFSRGAEKPTGTYCVPLSPGQIFDGLPKDIIDWASKPRTIVPYWTLNRKKLTFDAFLDKYQIRPSILSFSPEYGPGLITEFREGQGKNWEMLKQIMPRVLINGEVTQKQCYLHEHYWNHNPPHVIRFGSAAYWKKLSDDPRSHIRFDAEWVEQFYQAMQYDDVGSAGSKEEKERRDNIRSIWNRGPNSDRPWLPIYEEPSCKKLLSTAVCKGPACDLFFVFLKDFKEKFYQNADGSWQFIKEVINE